MTERAGGPYTSHGHAVEGVTVVGNRPDRVARCGGPGMCPQCSVEAEQIRRKAAKANAYPTNPNALWHDLNFFDDADFIALLTRATCPIVCKEHGDWHEGCEERAKQAYQVLRGWVKPNDG